MSWILTLYSNHEACGPFPVSPEAHVYTSPQLYIFPLLLPTDRILPPLLEPYKVLFTSQLSAQTLISQETLLDLH